MKHISTLANHLTQNNAANASLKATNSSQTNSTQPQADVTRLIPAWTIAIGKKFSNHWGALFLDQFVTIEDKREWLKDWQFAIEKTGASEKLIIETVQDCIEGFEFPPKLKQFLDKLNYKVNRAKDAQVFARQSLPKPEITCSPTVKQQALELITLALHKVNPLHSASFIKSIESNTATIEERQKKIVEGDFHDWKWWDSMGNIDHVKRDAYLAKIRE